MGAPALVTIGILLKGFGILLILGSFAVAISAGATAAVSVFFGGIVVLIVGHVVKSAGKHAKHVVEVRMER